MPRSVSSPPLSYRKRVHLTSVDAEVPELDNDVGTGTEGDVEARCFSEPSPAVIILGNAMILIAYRT